MVSAIYWVDNILPEHLLQQPLNRNLSILMIAPWEVINSCTALGVPYCWQHFYTLGHASATLRWLNSALSWEKMSK